MKRLALIAAGGATLVAALLAAPIGAVTSQGVSGLVVFQSDRTGNSEIWVMNLDGSGQRQLTNNAFADATPAWTPDGEIVFASTRAGSWDIWKMDDNGQNAVRLTPGTDGSHEFDPAVSDDGTVAYEGDARGNWDVYRLPGGDPTSDPIRMTTSPNNDYDPSFSLDGGEITFATGTRASFDVSVVPTESSGAVRRISTPIRLSFDPRWSPTGNDIVFTRQSATPGGRDIVRMQSDGENVQPLTGGATDDWGPAWTGEGRIVFTRSTQDAVGGAYHLFVMNEDGSGERRLTTQGRGVNMEADVRLVPTSSLRTPAAYGAVWALSAGCKTGTGGSNRLLGTAGNDCIQGLAGNDTIEGRAGNDTIYGGAGSDTVTGGHGVDTIYGRGGDDALYGNFGNDRIWGDLGADSLFGGDGADRIFAADGQPDLINGGASPGDEAILDENLDARIVDAIH